jgi:hypothetical protein
MVSARCVNDHASQALIAKATSTPADDGAFFGRQINLKSIIVGGAS